MNVIRNSKQARVVGETEKSYLVRPISENSVWWPKSQCKIDHNFYESQLAIHLYIGYAGTGSVTDVAKISAFVPALILASRKLEAQIEAGREDWDGVFVYDVAQDGGYWLNKNTGATVEQFKLKLEELIAS